MSIFSIPSGIFTTVLWLLNCWCVAVLKHCADIFTIVSLMVTVLHFLNCCCTDGGCSSETWQKSSSSVGILGLACSICLSLYELFSSFLPNSKGWVDLRTEPSSSGSCIKVMFYRGVKVRTTDDLGAERWGHVLITPSGLLFQQVMSPQSPSLFFYCRIFLFCIQYSLFPGVCLSIHVLSYYSLLPKPNLLSGCGCDVWFPRSAFPFNIWLSAVPWRFCHYTLQICGFVFYRGVSSKDWRVNAGSVNMQDPPRPQLHPFTSASSPDGAFRPLQPLLSRLFLLISLTV